MGFFPAEASHPSFTSCTATQMWASRTSHTSILPPTLEPTSPVTCRGSSQCRRSNKASDCALPPPANGLSPRHGSSLAQAPWDSDTRSTGPSTALTPAASFPGTRGSRAKGGGSLTPRPNAVPCDNTKVVMEYLGQPKAVGGDTVPMVRIWHALERVHPGQVVPCCAAERGGAKQYCHGRPSGRPCTAPQCPEGGSNLSGVAGLEDLARAKSLNVTLLSSPGSHSSLLEPGPVAPGPQAEPDVLTSLGPACASDTDSSSGAEGDAEELFTFTLRRLVTVPEVPRPGVKSQFGGSSPLPLRSGPGLAATDPPPDCPLLPYLLEPLAPQGELCQGQSSIWPPAHHKCTAYSLAELESATGHWAPGNVLGRGGFGAVYKGHLRGVPVAVKRLEGGGWQGGKEYSMEVQVLGGLDHPHIVKLLGHCIEGHCLVYELVEGGNLQQALSRQSACAEGEEGAMGWRGKVAVLEQLASALAALHQSGPPVVHRDLKPENILLRTGPALEDVGPCRDEQWPTVKLADVGLARLMKDEDGSNRTYTVSGTAGYIDPESLRTFEVSPLADVYAFGLVMLQLLLDEPRVQKIHRLLEAQADEGSRHVNQRRSGALVEMVAGMIVQRNKAMPSHVSRHLAGLALLCVQRKSAFRPDLAGGVLPALEKVWGK